MKVAVVPVPVIVVEPTDSVIVQVPAAGKPLKATLPVAVAQVGCVIVPIVGAFGVEIDAFITAFKEATEVQPTEFVTLKV